MERDKRVCLTYHGISRAAGVHLCAPAGTDHGRACAAGSGRAPRPGRRLNVVPHGASRRCPAVGHPRPGSFPVRGAHVQAHPCAPAVRPREQPPRPKAPPHLSHSNVAQPVDAHRREAPALPGGPRGAPLCGSLRKCGGVAERRRHGGWEGPCVHGPHGGDGLVGNPWRARRRLHTGEVGGVDRAGGGHGDGGPGPGRRGRLWVGYTYPTASLGTTCNNLLVAPLDNVIQRTCAHVQVLGSNLGPDTGVSSSAAC